MGMVHLLQKDYANAVEKLRQAGYLNRRPDVARGIGEYLRSVDDVERDRIDVADDVSVVR